MRGAKLTLVSSFLAMSFGMFGFATMANAQGDWHHGRGHNSSWPDSLQTETFTGTAIVDSSFYHPQYFLDVNGDDVADYRLMFGPWWYTPENGATRPQQGESVTVTGAVTGDMMYQGVPGVVVFELNGLKWRDPIAVGGHGWNMGDFWDMNGDTLTTTGTVFVDTTYFYPVYFLDTDADSLPDYMLGFGPPWYEPGNGVTRPADGEVVTIFGRTWNGMMGFAMLMVYEINGQEWQPDNQPAPWAGSWMHRNHADSAYVYCANDSSNWIGFAPGHMGRGMGGMHGMRWPDSAFVQFWQVFPDSLPGGHNPGHFMGFYVDVQDPQGNTMMGGSQWGGNDWGGHHGWMNFEKEHQLHFQYRDEDLQAGNLDENSMVLRYWDASQNSWQVAQNATVDPVSNTVTLSSNQLNTYYALSAPALTTGIDDAPASATPQEFRLLGNYPNPFNPETTIAFELAQSSPVRLEIYNVVGQRLVLLIDEVREAGSHRIVWNGRDAQGRQLPTGIYLLKLQAGTQTAIRRMTLLK